MLAGCPGCGTLGISIVPRLRPGAFVLGNAFGALRLGTHVVIALSRVSIWRVFRIPWAGIPGQFPSPQTSS